MYTRGRLYKKVDSLVVVKDSYFENHIPNIADVKFVFRIAQGLTTYDLIVCEHFVKVLVCNVQG